MNINYEDDGDILTDEEVDTEEDLGNGKRLIVHNDDINTFDGVIEALIKVVKLDMEQAIQCTYIVHYRGKCMVKEGSEEKLKAMKESLVNRGIIASLED